jgi:hypothetical protein
VDRTALIITDKSSEESEFATPSVVSDDRAENGVFSHPPHFHAASLDFPGAIALARRQNAASLRTGSMSEPTAGFIQIHSTFKSSDRLSSLL